MNSLVKVPPYSKLNFEGTYYYSTDERHSSQSN